MKKSGLKLSLSFSLSLSLSHAVLKKRLLIVRTMVYCLKVYIILYESFGMCMLNVCQMP